MTYDHNHNHGDNHSDSDSGMNAKERLGMRVAVAGGTGLVGRHVVEELTAAGQEPVVLSRSHGVDLVTGAGLDAAMADVDAVIDVSNTTTTSGKKAIAFFDSAAHHLLDASERAAVGHYVLLSIVGIDRVGLGYYQGKLRQEDVVKNGRTPWTVLRATQFHEFAEQTLDRVPKPLAVVPRMRTQPVAAREVAQHLVRLVLAPAQGMAPDHHGCQGCHGCQVTRSLVVEAVRARMRTAATVGEEVKAVVTWRSHAASAAIVPAIC